MIQEGGPSAYLSLTNFSGMEFFRLWDKMQGHVSSNWAVGRGKKSKYKAKDIFFMTLVTLKHAGSWDWLARMFKMKGATFERIIVKFIRMLAPKLYEIFVESAADGYTISKLASTGSTFANYPCARYAVDVTFQQANRPNVSLADGKNTTVENTKRTDLKQKFQYYQMVWHSVALFIALFLCRI